MKFMVISLFVAFSLASAIARGDEKRFLSMYKGDVEIPGELYRTYERLVKAFRKGDQKAIKNICLPRAVKINTGMRPVDRKDIGSDINMIFARDSFVSTIHGISKGDHGVFSLRTGSSYLSFVETKHSGWRLFYYFDKSID